MLNNSGDFYKETAEVFDLFRYQGFLNGGFQPFSGYCAR